VIPRRSPRLVVFAASVVAAAVGILGALVAVVAAATPALAIGERGDPGHGLTWVQTVLIYLGIPVAVGAVITFLVLLPSLVKGPRYRPGRPWTAGSVWFGGPEDAATALGSVTTIPAATIEGGGASARW
jgi:hypothetical protein